MLATPFRPGLPALVRFGAGDFACNLFWQGIALYLLYFYTEAMGLPPAVAGAVFMAGAVWDGLADVAMGFAAERSRRGYAWFVGWGAVPLGLSFPLAFYVPPLEGSALVAFACLGQLGLRSLYAFVNVPYAAWSARVSEDSRDRTRVAGLRLAFGAAAAAGVAVAFPWAAVRIGHAGAAGVLAAIGVPTLLMVARTVPEAHRADAARARLPIRTMLAGLARNRAFTTLTAAMMAAAVAGTLMSQSVLYYFGQVLGTPDAGPRALAAMAVSGAVGVPVWTAVALRIGARKAWLASAVVGLALIGVFAAGGRGVAVPWLAAMQFVLTGLLLAGWSALPEAVDAGERATGLRVEAPAFGMSALLQKLAIAGATLVLGLVYDAAGYTGGVVGEPAKAAIAGLMILGPAIALAASIVAMLACPIRRA